MVNAGIAIRPFSGQQIFDAEQGLWKGIGVTVNYPESQNPTDNPIEVDDILIEPNGRVWVVKTVIVEDEAAGDFRLGLQLRDRETTDADTPALGAVSRGGIITPRRGYIAPHWDTLLVESAVGRIAAMANMDNIDNIIPLDTWTGVVDGGTLTVEDTTEESEGV